jgi:photosystem II stability/assembly factor-like uncharacterized protein
MTTRIYAGAARGSPGEPGDPNQVYCATRGGQVFGTQDGGESWHEYPLPEDVQDVYAVNCC